jgi:superfamily II DNA or RNA helicase
MRVDQVLTLGTKELSQREWRRLFSRLRYQDDEGNVYEPWQVYPHKGVVRIPRGAWSLLPDHVVYDDERVLPERHDFDFIVPLDSNGFSGQKDAVKAMFEQEQGIIVAQPSFGKTNVVLAFASACGTRVLVLVHTEDILQQWLDRCEEVCPEADVGVIRGTEETIGDITISTVQTFRKRVQLQGSKLSAKFGAVILDEAHHAPASTFDEILNELPAKYRFGVTATDKRADQRHPYMTTVLGPVIYRHKFVSRVPVSVVPVKSGFYYGYRGSFDWRNLLDKLTADEQRNQRIAKVAFDELVKGNSTLILSREIAHLEAIHKELEVYCMVGGEDIDQAVILAARLVNKKQRHEMLDKFRAGEIKVVLATQLADEALDVPILSRVVLAYPGKHDGRIIQQIGRALREHEGKREAVIYDVVDDRVGVLRRQWMKRKQTYKTLKIKVRKLR